MKLTPYTLDQRLKKIRRNTIAQFWEFVEMLREARKGKIWEKLDYDSWSAYLAQPELSLRENTVNNYITALNRFEEFSLPISVVPCSRAMLIAPKLTKGNAEELVLKAQELSWSDLRKEINPSKNDDCFHIWERITVKRCKSCGKILVV